MGMSFLYRLAAFVVLAICSLHAGVAAAKRPNIVFILVDDQDLLLHSLDRMDNVQKQLIQEGTFFKKHYGHVSQCCPARATIWTGLHSHNTNVTNVFNGVSILGFQPRIINPFANPSV